MPQKLGLALGGGGARGAAHIGVLQEFEENQIPIDLIVGTSMGSIIGALYAHEHSLELIREYISKTRLGSLRYFRYFHRGIFSAKFIEKSCSKILGNTKFDELSIPMAAVSTDLLSGESVILREGIVAKALSASSAFLPLFAPIEMDGRLLVDGGVLSNVPADAARNLGADIVIAVDLGNVPLSGKKLNIMSIVGRASDIMIRKITDNRLKQADVIITPDIDQFSIFDFKHCDELIEKGRESTRKSIPAIKEILASR